MMILEKSPLKALRKMLARFRVRARMPEIDPKVAARARHLRRRIITERLFYPTTQLEEELQEIWNQYPSLVPKYSLDELTIRHFRHSRKIRQTQIDTILLNDTPTRRQYCDEIEELTSKIEKFLAEHPDLAAKYPEPAPAERLAKLRRRRSRLLNELEILKNPTPDRHRRVVELNVVESKIDALLEKHPELMIPEKPKETPHHRKLRYHVQGLKGQVTFLKKRREYYQSEELRARTDDLIAKIEQRLVGLEARLAE